MRRTIEEIWRNFTLEVYKEYLMTEDHLKTLRYPIMYGVERPKEEIRKGIEEFLEKRKL